jgi:DNA-binding CsgD family transcriptional regulator
MAFTVTTTDYITELDPREARQTGSGNPFGLTIRELEVIDAVLRAESTSSIATRLSIARGTVKNHLSSIFAKAGVVNRVQLVRFAVDHRLAEPRLGN